MKLSIVLCCCLVLGFVPLKAQKFLPLTWEQASMQAAKENKLVFVDVMSSGMKSDPKKEKTIFSDPQVAEFMRRNAIMIRVDMGTPVGMEFAPRLMMNMYPVYAFFMPYGDLLSIASPFQVASKPQLLVEAGEKALKLAEVKRANSRAIRFEEGNFEEVLAKAGKLGKMVFIDAYTDYCQPCLMMEKNVFTLDSVADFYNRNFVNVKLHFGKVKGLAEKYNVGGYPSFLFVNSEGKLIHKAGGYSPAEQFIGYGKEALKKAKGIDFQSLTLEEAKTLAQQQKRSVFLCFYDQTDRGYKEMVKNVFVDPEVAELFNGNFVSVTLEKGQEQGMQEKMNITSWPVFIFINADGKEIHRFVGVTDVTGLLREGKNVLEGNGLEAMTAKYLSGNRENDFVEAYIVALGRANRKVEAGKIALDYLSGLGNERLKEKKYWEFFDKYVTDANSDLFKYVYANRKEFYQLYGQQAVDVKLRNIWASGANQFLSKNASGYVFDEAGLKEYIRRMKKEKVSDWRAIVRNTRMLVAEKTGDWKKYVELAEEKWNEEDISNAELYSWGVKIDQECHDEATRFKAARWFALAAIEMERKEQLSGKVNITSYKSFFEKLVDDLVKKK